MKKSKKRFYIWHFFIFIPILIIINVLDVDKILQKKGEKPIEKTIYEELDEGFYTLFDVISGDEIGEIEIFEIILSEKLLLNFNGKEISGKNPIFKERGKYNFQEVNVESLVLNRTVFKDEIYWAGQQNDYNVVMVNMFTDRSSIPEKLKDSNRKYYLICFIEQYEFDYIIDEKSILPIRRILFNSFYEGRYAAIFFVDIPVE